MKNLLLAVCFLVFFGCTKIGNQKLFDEEFTNKIRVGMSLTQAIEILGKPRMTNKNTNTSNGAFVKTVVWVASRNMSREASSISVTVGKDGKILSINKTNLE